VLAGDCTQREIRLVLVAGNGNGFSGPDFTDTRSERSTKLFDKRPIHFNLEAVTFEDRHELGDPAIASDS
jgi:hypothetical protein